ncbi:MAG: acyl-CoA thioesterase [Syntrophaceae bacterium]|nr:acyl-CoA thioesterase [Syntrophaceae bacterium]
MTHIYQYKSTVPDRAIDVNGHVSNIEYLCWMQEAAVFHMDIQACNKATLDEEVMWVFLMHHIKYLRPEFGGKDIIVLTWVSHLNRFQSLRKFALMTIRYWLRVKPNGFLLMPKLDVCVQFQKMLCLKKNCFQTLESEMLGELKIS